MTTEATVQSQFLRDAVARGQFHQCTDLEGLDKAALAGVTDLQGAGEALVQGALARGGRDNVTVVLARFEA